MYLGGDMTEVRHLGDGNSVCLGTGARAPAKLEIKRGAGNRILIGNESKLRGSIVIRGNGNTILIGNHCDWRGDIVVKGDKQTVSIGDYSTAVNAYLLCQEGCDITIGRWCMFSRGIEVRTTDAHSVIDRATGERLNRPASIVVGDHVWVGLGVIINKGAVVPSDCIVGAQSFVTTKFSEEGVVIAGTPARIVKRGITWARERKNRFTQKELNRWKG